MATPQEEEGQVQEEQPEPKIINLSSLELSERHICVLRKGLKFCPTPRYNENTVKSDIQQFVRKLRLEENFHDTVSDCDSLVRNKSHFMPDKGRDGHLDLYIDFLNKAPTGKKVPGHHKNMNSEEIKALNELKHPDGHNV